MTELQATAESIQEMIVEKIQAGAIADAQYNLAIARTTNERRLRPGRPTIKTSSRSLLPQQFDPYYKTYDRLGRCLEELDRLLQKDDRENSLKKAQEAILILCPKV